MPVNFPLSIDRHGRTARVDDETHIRQMIEQVLFTMPGERVNRPDFGSGLMQLVFAPNSGELAAAVEYLVQGALQQWLGELIQVDGVAITHADESLLINIAYTVRRSQTRQRAQFRQGVGA